MPPLKDRGTRGEQTLSSAYNSISIARKPREKKRTKVIVKLWHTDVVGDQTWGKGEWSMLKDHNDHLFKKLSKFHSFFVCLLFSSVEWKPACARKISRYQGEAQTEDLT